MFAGEPARQPLESLGRDVADFDRGGVLRAHQPVHTAHGDGVVTSGTFAPTLGASIALARVPAACVPGERVQVAVRDKLLAARAVQPPFVRHGKILV